MTRARTGGEGDTALRDAIEQAVVARAGLGTAQPTASSAFLQLIVAGEEAAAVVHGLQQSAVAQARRSGISWAAIGEALGTSRQAAQQRFAADEPEDEGAAGVRRIYGANAFNEMKLLAEEGRAGHHLVGLGALYLEVRASRRAWEHRRELALHIGATRARLERAGWEYVGAWSPFHYFKRPLAG